MKAFGATKTARRVSRSKKPRQPQTKTVKKGVKFRPCTGFYVYLAALLFAALFTQLLRSHISAILYIFLIALPFAAVILLFVSSAAVTIFLASPQTVGRETPVTVSLKIVNASPFPLPRAECDLSLPGSNLPNRRLTFSLAPAGAYSITETLNFKYRGEYSIGIPCLYVYDIFGLFRLRADISSFTCVYVTPRRLSVSTAFPLARLDAAPSSRLRSDSDRSDTGELTAYTEGDSPRDIQWKLAARSDELIVRRYVSNDSDRVLIFCDLAGYGETLPNGGDDELGDYIVNGAVETALALCFDSARLGRSVSVIWRDPSYEKGMAVKYGDSDEARDEIFMLLTSAKTCAYGQTSPIFGGALDGVSNAAIIIVSGRIDRELDEIITTALSIEGAAVSLCCINSDIHIAGEENLVDRREFMTAARARLSAEGVQTFEPEYLRRQS